MIAALTKNSEEADEFGQRVRIAELALKEKEINIKDKDVTANLEITRMQMQQPKVQ
jgi:hypothetical protein